MGTVFPEWMAWGVPIMADAALKGVVLLAAAGAATLAMRRASAAMRHLVWSLAIMGLLALPVLSALLPQWQVLPQWNLVSTSAATSSSDVAQSPPAVNDMAPAPRGVRSLGEVGSAANPPLSTDVTQPPPAVNDVAGVAQPPSAVNNLAYLPPDNRSLPWREFFPLFWIFGAAIALIPVVVGRLALWRLCRGARRIETTSSWTDLLRTLAEKIRLRQRIALLRSDRAVMPMAWGICRARILLPGESDDWPAERRRLVLLHEMAHIHRRDCLTQFLTNLACAMHWFNPLVWIARRQMVAERERACDDLVLAAGFAPSDYAQELLHVAAGLRGGFLASGAAIAMARPSKLEGRLLAILDGKRNRRALTRWIVGIALILAALIVVPLACVKAADESRTSLRVARWVGILDTTTAENLVAQGASTVDPKSPDWRIVRIDSKTLLSRACDANWRGLSSSLDWWRPPRNGKMRGDDFLTEAKLKGDGVDAGFDIMGSLNLGKYQIVKNRAELELDYPSVRVSRFDYARGEGKKWAINGGLRVGASLADGDAVVALGPASVAKETGITCVVVWQAIGVPHDLLNRVDAGSFCSAKSWLIFGPEGVAGLQTGLQVRPARARILDAESGEPVANAKVSLLHWKQQNAGPNEQKAGSFTPNSGPSLGTSDVEGHVTIDGLPGVPGRIYWAAIAADGYALRTCGPFAPGEDIGDLKLERPLTVIGKVKASREILTNFAIISPYQPYDDEVTTMEMHDIRFYGKDEEGARLFRISNLHTGKLVLGFRFGKKKQEGPTEHNKEWVQDHSATQKGRGVFERWFRRDAPDQIRVQYSIDLKESIAGLVITPDGASIEPKGTPWGEAVEGVQVRLRAEKHIWQAGDTPFLSADLRNTGEKRFLFAPTQEAACPDLEFDGKTYQWVGPAAGLILSDFPPARSFKNIIITVGQAEVAGQTEGLELWAAKDGTPLEVGPGKHVVRVTFTIQRTEKWGGGTIRVTSNPVEITVEPEAATKVIRYTVKGGDTLAAIAKQHLGSETKWRDIARENGLSNRYIQALKIGDVLTITVPE